MTKDKKFKNLRKKLLTLEIYLAILIRVNGFIV